MTEFERQIWTATFAAEYVRMRAVSEHLHSTAPTRYMSPKEAGLEHGAAEVAAEAVRKIRKLKKSEDAPYLFLTK